MHVHESPRQPQLHDRNLSCEWQAWEHRQPFFGVPTFFPFFPLHPFCTKTSPFDDRRRQRVSVVETVNAMICPEEWKAESCPGVVDSTWQALFPFPFAFPRRAYVHEVRRHSSLLITVIAVITARPTSTSQRRSHPRGKLSRGLEL